MVSLAINITLKLIMGAEKTMQLNHHQKRQERRGNGEFAVIIENVRSYTRTLGFVYKAYV